MMQARLLTTTLAAVDWSRVRARLTDISLLVFRSWEDHKLLSLGFTKIREICDKIKKFWRNIDKVLLILNLIQKSAILLLNKIIFLTTTKFNFGKS